MEEAIKSHVFDHYGLTLASAKRIQAGVMNANFFCEIESGEKYIFKIYNHKSSDEIEFEMEILTKQLRPPSPIEGDLVLVAYLFYKDNRSDLDASQLADNLQKFGIIKNDRQLKEHHLYRNISKDNSRAEIYLYRLST